jgi:alcohol dehydrogenase
LHVPGSGGDAEILKGDIQSCPPGRILGHVDLLHLRLRKCDYCRRGMYSHCTTGGWILGNQIDGTQAEYVRTPHADTSLYRIPTAPTRKLWPC